MKNAKSVLNISAFYNGFPGIHHASLRRGTICVYYIPLTVLRGSIIIAAKKMAWRAAQEDKIREDLLKMPIGIIVNALAVIIGGLLGTAAGKKLPQRLKDALNMVFGVSALAMGVASVVLMKNMPAVIFSVIIGTGLGIIVRLGDCIDGAARGMQKAVSHFVKPPENGMTEKEFTATLVTIIVLFCASGTGIYGSIVSGISGDHSILLAKSILDIFTAMIFACSLGMVVSLISVPQLLIFLMLFFLAKVIGPLCSDTMINDFKACGGVILLATGFRMLKLKEFPVADMIPAMVIVMPVSFLWTQYILPLIG